MPGSGNLTVGGQQFWLGRDRAGQSVTLWADPTVVHLLINGVRLKTVPSGSRHSDTGRTRRSPGIL